MDCNLSVVLVLFGVFLEKLKVLFVLSDELRKLEQWCRGILVPISLRSSFPQLHTNIASLKPSVKEVLGAIWPKTHNSFSPEEPTKKGGAHTLPPQPAIVFLSLLVNYSISKFAKFFYLNNHFIPISKEYWWLTENPHTRRCPCGNYITRRKSKHLGYETD